LEDFGKVLALDPRHRLGRLRRAEVEMFVKNLAAAGRDLDAADGRVAQDDGVRLSLGKDYLGANRIPEASRQVEAWIRHHDEDG
jgi:hypothetical protein